MYIHNYTCQVLTYLNNCLYQEIKSCGLLCYTEQASDSREEVTNRPRSGDGGTLSGGSAQPRISSQFKSRQK